MKSESESVQDADFTGRERSGLDCRSAPRFADLKGDGKVGTKAAVPNGRQLTEQMIHALRNSGYPSLHDISVIRREGIVVLRGNVPSYHMKQLAQTVVRKVTETDEIRNELEVP